MRVPIRQVGEVNRPQLTGTYSLYVLYGTNDNSIFIFVFLFCISFLSCGCNKCERSRYCFSRIERPGLFIKKYLLFSPVRPSTLYTASPLSWSNECRVPGMNWFL